MDAAIAHYAEGLIMLLIGIVGWFLRAKDEQQGREMSSMRDQYGKQITALWTKHDEDAKRLDDTIRVMDREHYTKTELDTRFDKLEQTVVREIGSVSNKLDKLTDAVAAHITRDERMWQEHFLDRKEGK